MKLWLNLFAAVQILILFTIAPFEVFATGTNPKNPLSEVKKAAIQGAQAGGVSQVLKRKPQIPEQRNSDYNPGPNPKSKMEKELIDIIAEIPNMPGISLKALGKQKFRPAYGPAYIRMATTPNSLKAINQGQDATHIAEGSKYPATAGYGGRVQDIMAYLGIYTSAGFFNTYPFTINGQYGAFGVPYAQKDASGKIQFRKSSFVDNQLWLMTNDLDSPITQWRNKLWDWLLRNNRDSLKMISLFGGAAHDSFAAFLTSRGVNVGSRHSADSMKSVQVPETMLVSAGGNNQAAVPVTREGKDLYSEFAGRKLVYGDNPKNKKVHDQFLIDQKFITDLLETRTQEVYDKMVFTNGGLHKSGLLNPAQLGGYDLSKIEINGEVTRSLKGLKLSDGTTIEQDVLVVDLPHPTALSMMDPDKASAAVAKSLEVVKPFMEEKNWTIEPDSGMVNHFAKGDPYKYGRSTLPDAYYAQGMPGTRRLPVSDAKRMTGKPNVIIMGTRNDVKVDLKKLSDAENAKPAEAIDPNQMLTARPRTPETRDLFDRGPGEKYSKLMATNLDMKAIFKPKPGMTWEKDGIEALNVKNDALVGAFADFRGTFVKPRIVILADPDGADDFNTERALTGTRGQYLQGLMNDLGVGDQHLVLKTVPFVMDGATEEEWKTVLGQTQKYRDEILSNVLADNPKVELIVTDGKYSKQEMERFLASRGVKNIPVVNIEKNGLGNSAGIVDAGKKIVTDLSQFKDAIISGERRNIPRTHLTFTARIWDGTSGDCVLCTIDETRGSVFVDVAPKWTAPVQELNAEENAGVKKLTDTLFKNHVPLPGEKISDFLARTGGAEAPAELVKLSSEKKRRGQEKVTDDRAPMNCRKKLANLAS